MKKAFHTFKSNSPVECVVARPNGIIEQATIYDIGAFSSAFGYNAKRVPKTDSQALNCKTNSVTLKLYK